MTQNGEPVNPNFEAFNVGANIFICPSDPNTGVGISENNYVYNFGGSTPFAGADGFDINVEMRRIPEYNTGGNGSFTIGKGLKPGKFIDGLSKTAMWSERTKGNGEASGSSYEGLVDGASVRTCTVLSSMVQSGRFFDAALGGSIDQGKQRGESATFTFNSFGRWLQTASGPSYTNGWPIAAYSSTMYNHHAPPSNPYVDCGVSFISDRPWEHAVISARSEHSANVVNVCFADGHVEGITPDIEIEVWRALGSRDGEREREEIEPAFKQKM